MLDFGVLQGSSRTVTNISQVVMFALLFGIIHRLVKLFVNRNARISQSVAPHQASLVTSIISSTHATLVTLYSLHILYTDRVLYQNKILYSSSAISFNLNMSVGYFVFDMVKMLRNKHDFEWGMVAHHVVSIFALFTCSNEGVFPFMALLRLTSEASTPFINNRWLMVKLRMQNSRLYMHNGLLAIALFFMVRIMTILPNWFFFFECVNTPAWYLINVRQILTCVLSCIPLDILNVFWFAKICKILVKYIRTELKRNAAGNATMLNGSETKLN